MATKTRRRFTDEDEDEMERGTYGMGTEDDGEDEDEDDGEGPGLRVKCPECETEMEVRMPKGLKLVDSEGEAVNPLRYRRGKKAGEAARLFGRGFREAMKNALPRHFA